MVPAGKLKREAMATKMLKNGSIGQIAEADEEEQVLVSRAKYDEHLRYLKKT